MILQTEYYGVGDLGMNSGLGVWMQGNRIIQVFLQPPYIISGSFGILFNTGDGFSLGLDVLRRFRDVTGNRLDRLTREADDVLQGRGVEGLVGAAIIEKGIPERAVGGRSKVGWLEQWNSCQRSWRVQ